MRGDVPIDPSAIKGAKKAAFPGFIEPCLAQLVEKPPAGEGWLHEIKFDGYRLMALIDGKRARLFTRSGLDWTGRFPGIAEAFEAFPAQTAIVDGEAVVEDENGVSSFRLCRRRFPSERPPARPMFFAFDSSISMATTFAMLRSTTARSILAWLLNAKAPACLALFGSLAGSGQSMLEHACRLGLEGIVSKRHDAPLPLRPPWRMAQGQMHNREEFVIGGYVPSTATRNAVGSLALGAYSEGKLDLYRPHRHRVHAKSCRNRFTGASASADAASRPSPIRFFGRAARACVRRAASSSRRLSFAAGHDRRLRHAAFKGLREDKPALEVHLEMPRQETGRLARARSRNRQGTRRVRVKPAQKRRCDVRRHQAHPSGPSSLGRPRASPS